MVVSLSTGIVFSSNVRFTPKPIVWWKLYVLVGPATRLPFATSSRSRPYASAESLVRWRKADDSLVRRDSALLWAKGRTKYGSTLRGARRAHLLKTCRPANSPLHALFSSYNLRAILTFFFSFLFTYISVSTFFFFSVLNIFFFFLPSFSLQCYSLYVVVVVVVFIIIASSSPQALERAIRGSGINDSSCTCIRAHYNLVRVAVLFAVVVVSCTRRVR